MFEQPEEPTFAPRREEVADDLPPPAYQPAPEPTLEAPEEFVAPRAAAPGTPTPEAMARLQAAVGRAPSGGQVDRPVAAGPIPTAPSADAAEEKRGFGINSLINRMTGSEPQQSARRAPEVTTIREEADVDPDQERIEIPAFLRRQAN